MNRIHRSTKDRAQECRELAERYPNLRDAYLAEARHWDEQGADHLANAMASPEEGTGYSEQDHGDWIEGTVYRAPFRTAWTSEGWKTWHSASIGKAPGTVVMVWDDFDPSSVDWTTGASGGVLESEGTMAAPVRVLEAC